MPKDTLLSQISKDKKLFEGLFFNDKEFKPVGIKEVEGNVFDFYTKLYNKEPKDHSLKGLKTNSNCGRGCLKVMKASIPLLKILNKYDDTIADDLKELVGATCSVLWRG